MPRKNVRKQRTLDGLCFRDGNPLVPGRTTCEPCLSEMRDRSKRIRDRRKEQDLCGCGKPSVVGFSECEECRARHVRNNAKNREQVFNNYGTICACCEERESRFLTIDHIHNDGAEHRRVVPASCLYRWLIKNSFPEGFQTLCHNCNSGKHLNGGICPHKQS